MWELWLERMLVLALFINPIRALEIGPGNIILAMLWGAAKGTNPPPCT